jgi:uncharacterized membrane protein YeaQ/YmgE (transglycosylase-associated protein family)
MKQILNMFLIVFPLCLRWFCLSYSPALFLNRSFSDIIFGIHGALLAKQFFGVSCVFLTRGISIRSFCNMIFGIYVVVFCYISLHGSKSDINSRRFRDTCLESDKIYRGAVTNDISSMS